MKPLIMQMSLTRMWGGAEIFELNFTRQLIAAGYRVHFICRTSSPLEERLSKEGVAMTTLDAGKYFSPRASAQLRKLIRKLAPTNIVFHALSDLWLVTPALMGMDAQVKPRQVGLIHTFVEKSKRDPFHRFIYSHMETLVCTTTPQMKALQNCLTLPADRYKVIPYFVDCEKFTPAKRSEPIRRQHLPDGNGILIGCFGRLEKSKGQMELFRAFKTVRERTSKKVKLIYVGGDNAQEPNFRQELQTEAERLELGTDVEFIPFQDNVADLMASLDIFAMPSRKEAFGIVSIEALASGVPVVSTNAGGVPDILDHGQTGLLAEPLDEPDLAEKLLKLVDDDETRRLLGQRSRQKAETVYAIPQVMSAWSDLLVGDRK